jgi:hypothetical protein
MESLRNVYQHEVGNPEKRSKNLRFLRNCALFVAAVVLIRKYGDLLLPPPAEELAKYIQVCCHLFAIY